MLGLADVIVRHGQDYLARHGSAVPQGHLRALHAISRCRTGALGGHLAQCTACGREHVLYHSCHHRACPPFAACAVESLQRASAGSWRDRGLLGSGRRLGGPPAAIARV